MVAIRRGRRSHDCAAQPAASVGDTERQLPHPRMAKRAGERESCSPKEDTPFDFKAKVARINEGAFQEDNDDGPNDCRALPVVVGHCVDVGHCAAQHPGMARGGRPSTPGKARSVGGGAAATSLVQDVGWAGRWVDDAAGPRHLVRTRTPRTRTRSRSRTPRPAPLAVGDCAWTIALHEDGGRVGGGKRERGRW